jgi:hypothetical protein
MYVLEEGFHALHWKMLSWWEFGCCVWGARFSRWIWVLRSFRGGFKVFAVSEVGESSVFGVCV